MRSCTAAGVRDLVMALSDLPPDLAAQLEGHDLIVFDAECVLCSRFYRFVLRFDRHQQFRFATAQSPLGQDLYRALDLPLEDFQTNLVITDGQLATHLDSVVAVMGKLGGAWRIICAIGLLPRVIKTPLYAAVARNRYRIFGRYETCMLPDAQARARFLPRGV